MMMQHHVVDMQRRTKTGIIEANENIETEFARWKYKHYFEFTWSKLSVDDCMLCAGKKWLSNTLKYQSRISWIVESHV